MRPINNVYLLKAAKSGLKIPELKPGQPISALPPPKQGATDSLNFSGTLQSLGDALSQSGQLDRPVIDRTGLKGNYFARLQWGTDQDVLTALEEDLGLKAEPGRERVEYLVIDHIERPDAN